VALNVSCADMFRHCTGVLVVEGILTEHEENHLDKCFTQRALCCAHGRAIWEPHGESFCKLARRVRVLQDCVLLIEDFASSFTRPIAAECKLDGSDCKVCLDCVLFDEEKETQRVKLQNLD